MVVFLIDCVIANVLIDKQHGSQYFNDSHNCYNNNNNNNDNSYYNHSYNQSDGWFQAQPNKFTQIFGQSNTINYDNNNHNNNNGSQNKNKKIKAKKKKELHFHLFFFNFFCKVESFFNDTFQTQKKNCLYF